ncbi:MAG: hypothetical protein M5U01_10055 [Ardenticatenaceae bacterium]|nr:hypothetical protein [Ardenticatenaceae bacterium]
MSAGRAAGGASVATPAEVGIIGQPVDGLAGRLIYPPTLTAEKALAAIEAREAGPAAAALALATGLAPPGGD